MTVTDDVVVPIFNEADVDLLDRMVASARATMEEAFTVGSWAHDEYGNRLGYRKPPIPRPRVNR